MKILHTRQSRKTLIHNTNVPPHKQDYFTQHIHIPKRKFQQTKKETDIT